MSALTLYRRSLTLWVVVFLWPASAYALTVASLNPNDYVAAPLVEGTSYYIETADVITSIPLALAGGTLVRTAPPTPPTPH
jgi:hypothetical protein